MGQEIYVDCEGRTPERAVEAVRRDVGALRPGASTVVAQTADPSTLQAVVAWAGTHGLRPTVEPRGGDRVWVRLFVLPSQFGDLPDCALRELRRSCGTRRRIHEVQHYAI